MTIFCIDFMCANHYVSDRMFNGMHTCITVYVSPNVFTPVYLMYTLTRMSPYITCIYLYVTCMHCMLVPIPVCTHILFVCHS